MKVLILNASPKNKGSTSAFYSSLLRLFLPGCEVKTCPLRGTRDHTLVFSRLSWADAVIISSPLYVDAAPAHIVDFLEQAEPALAGNVPCILGSIRSPIAALSRAAKMNRTCASTKHGASAPVSPGAAGLGLVAASSCAGCAC